MLLMHCSKSFPFPVSLRKTEAQDPEAHGRSESSTRKKTGKHEEVSYGNFNCLMNEVFSVLINYLNNQTVKMLIGITVNYYFHVYGVFLFAQKKILSRTLIAVYGSYEREFIHA